MTAKNMARHRNNPNMAFWKMLKEGSDHFEVTHLEPKVDVCEKRYVFDAAQEPGSNKPPNFSPAGKCPVFQVPEDIAQAVRDKESRDDAEFTQLVARNEPTAPMKRGIDGGMNAVFAAKLPDGQTGLSENNTSNLAVASYSTTPTTLPGTVNPPHAPEPAVAVAPPPPPPPAPAPATRVASARLVGKVGRFLLEPRAQDRDRQIGHDGEHAAGQAARGRGEECCGRRAETGACARRGSYGHTGGKACRNGSGQAGAE